MIERLPAGRAAVECLTGRRGEAADEFDHERTAARAGRLFFHGADEVDRCVRIGRAHARRRNAVRAELLVHAGASHTSIARCAMPSRASRAAISHSMARIAGQPEYVGVIATRSVRAPPSFDHATSRTMPRSRIEIAGISGSGISPSQFHTSASSGSRATIAWPESNARRTAFRPADSRALRYVARACRRSASSRRWERRA